MPKSALYDRRLFLASVATTALADKTQWAVAAESSPAGPALPLGARLPKFEFVYECEVKIAAALDFGTTSEGHRRIIPITGGAFRGPLLRGEVVSNGADWNLQRTDGTASVEAAYYLKTDDGVLIRIVNKGVSGPAAHADPNDDKERFLMYTSPTFEAPVGKYDWMNHCMFVGTLSVRQGMRDAVLIRVFRML